MWSRSLLLTHEQRKVDHGYRYQATCNGNPCFIDFLAIKERPEDEYQIQKGPPINTHTEINSQRRLFCWSTTYLQLAVYSESVVLPLHQSLMIL